ncbi:MAG: hypothetical protein MUF42_11495 [Cytophagaceae bacterium]|jgi:hypothetical protein|nr:hypothetical protein [Cytophagaceae bacterium]
MLIGCLGNEKILAKPKNRLPISLVQMQFAGSIGMVSLGYFKTGLRERIKVGVMGGYTPEEFGGKRLGSITLKFGYTPIRFLIKNRLEWKPIAAGIFLTQHLGENLHLRWPKQYKRGYYYWTNSLRQHAFVATHINYLLKKGLFKRLDFIQNLTPMICMYTAI